MIRWERQHDGNWLGLSGELLVATVAKDAHRGSDLDQHQLRGGAILCRTPALVCGSRKRPNPTGLVPGGLIEFSFHSFVEFRREKLQSNDTGAPDDFLRHAGDHIVP